MHILIAVITALAGLLWALHSLQHSGVDLNSFNPFVWARRRRWEKRFGAKPIYNLPKPMDAAAVIMLGLLKEEGEISREQKQAVIDLFKSDFNLNNEDAVVLFASSAYLIKDEINFDQSIKHVLKPCLDKFTPDMAASFLDMLKQLAVLDSAPTKSQLAIIFNVQQVFDSINAASTNWG